MQGTLVQSLAWEDPTCHEATKPVHHNYRVHTTTTEAPAPGASALQQEKPPQWDALAPQLESGPSLSQLEKACTKQWRPGTAKNKWISIFKRETTEKMTG